MHFEKEIVISLNYINILMSVFKYKYVLFWVIGYMNTYRDDNGMVDLTIE